MKWLIIIALICIALYSLHRLALWMEARGWIYYKHRKASPATRASAALELQTLIEPQKRHVLRVKQEEHFEEDDKGEP